MATTRTRLALGAALLLALAAGGAWLTAADAPAPPASAPGGESASTAHDAPATPRQGAPAADPALDALDDQLAAWRDLFAPRGRLTVEQTRALIAERDAAAEALAAHIGGLSAADLEGVLSRFQSAKTRDKLVLIDGLGRNADPAAVSILEELYGDESGYTMRSNILVALGDSDAPDHTALLVHEMWNNPDERLSQTAAMMLRGEADAADALAAAIDSALPMKTRLEAVASLGAVGSEQARAALEAVVADEDAHARVRSYAEKELARSFG